MLTCLVENLYAAALFDCCSPAVAQEIRSHPAYSAMLDLAIDDLIAYSEKDPATAGDFHLVAQCYTSYKAVLHYRLAHGIAENFSSILGRRADEIAMVISSRGKLQSGAEIHHRCRIGQRFVLDHGYGTVIGETTEIGDDCYLLNGVTLGAIGIADNPAGKRHPTIGSRVQIGAFARVYGDIKIGDDVFLGPHTLIKEDVPAGSKITAVVESQVARSRRIPSDHNAARQHVQRFIEGQE